jgi:hypothetical protein
MRPYDQFHSPNPDERFHEIASIFAAGVLRLQDRHALSVDPENPSEFASDCLAFPEEFLLSVTGVNNSRDPEKGAIS